MGVNAFLSSYRVSKLTFPITLLFNFNQYGRIVVCSILITVIVNV